MNKVRRRKDEECSSMKISKCSSCDAIVFQKSKAFHRAVLLY